MSNGNLDPEVADLLGEVDKDIASQKGGGTAVATSPPPAAPSLVAKKPVTVSSDYFQKVIEGEDKELAERMATQLDKAMNAPVREDRTIFKQKLIATYWNFLSAMAPKITGKLSIEKQLCIRYGIADISLLKPDQAEMMKSIPLNSTVSQEDWPFYYMDEWLKEIASGKIKPSMIDETQLPKTDSSAAQEKLDRKIDSRNATLTLYQNKSAERDAIERRFQDSVGAMFTHNPLPQYNNLPDAYTPEQKNIMSKITDDLRKLKTLDNVLLSYLRELRTIDTDIENIKNKMGDAELAAIDSGIIVNEFNSLRQMIKMCAGPRGNHFPILIKDYCPETIEMINTKENLVKLIQELEHKDEGAFYREFKGQRNRIVPYIMLVPGYGEKGICWEPFDIKQRATSRGRIALPLYPRLPKYSLLTAVGDLRWQVAKEKAGYRWMEEGLTGKYYDYFTENKLKGNIKDEFVKDYMIWLLQEWNGTQKLEREVRTIFWRHIPFPQSKKDELKNRGFFYNDLYKKDQNRAMSDGY